MYTAAPAFLSELFRSITIMTIIGSVVALLLLLAKPILRHRLPKSAQYYMWLVVIISLLVPLSRLIILPDTMVLGFNAIHEVVGQNVLSTDEALQRQAALNPIMGAPNMENAPAIPSATHNLSSDSLPATSPGLLAQISTILMLVYPWVALTTILFNIAGYIRYTMKVRRYNFSAAQYERFILKHLLRPSRMKRIPRLYRNTLIETPMLIGLFKPAIILPDWEYTEEQMQSILLHEIIHLRRMDIIIKWVSLFACAVHWFNPIVWVERREISRACELSCDEAVIKNMDNHTKQNYGETLIYVAADTKTPLTVLSTTMCEEKRELKERLISIMKNKNYTKMAVLASALIFIVVTLVACMLATGTETGNGSASSQVRETSNYLEESRASDNEIDSISLIEENSENNETENMGSETSHENYEPGIQGEILPDSDSSPDGLTIADDEAEWNNPWQVYPSGEERIFTFNDGTIATTSGYVNSSISDDKNGRITFWEGFEVQLTNGVVVNIPVSLSSIWVNDNIVSIEVINTGDAYLIDLNGDIVAIPQGSSINNNGNFITLGGVASVDPPQANDANDEMVNWDDISQFISWHHSYDSALGPNGYAPEVNTLFAIYRTWQMESMLGNVFEANVEKGGFMIRTSLVVNAVSYLYDIDGNSVEYDDFYIDENNPGYYWMPEAFSAGNALFDIHRETLTYNGGRYTFDVSMYNGDSYTDALTFTYEFEPVIYRVEVECYRFIGAVLK